MNEHDEAGSALGGKRAAETTRSMTALRDAMEHFAEAQRAAAAARSMSPAFLGAAQDLAQMQNTAAAMRSAMSPVFRLAQQFADETGQFPKLFNSMRPIVELMRENAELRQSLRLAPLFSGYRSQIGLATDLGFAQLAESAQLRAERHAVAILAAATAFTRATETARASEHEPAGAQEAAPADPVRALHLVAFAIVLVWLIALSVPAAQLALPQEAKDYLNSLYGTVALALAIHWRLNDKRKR